MGTPTNDARGTPRDGGNLDLMKESKEMARGEAPQGVAGASLHTRDVEGDVGVRAGMGVG